MKAGDVSLFEDPNKTGVPGHVALCKALRADLDLETALSICMGQMETNK
jgi:hypothetical protein